MHEWHTRTSSNIQSLINEFIGYEHSVDEGYDTVKNVRITDRVFTNEEQARDYVTRVSYGGETAYIATINPTNKTTKGYQTAYKSFIEKGEDYKKFNDNLSIAYGRKSSKVTCPECGSSIAIKYGSRFKSCPVCKSRRIISDSNWKALETKRKLVDKASQVLKEQADKCGITFICGIEWHY